MSFITTKDGTQIFYKDWGTGQPIVFHHGWPLSGDDWYNQLSLLGRAVETRDDSGLADIDALSHRYLGEPYEDRSYAGVSVLFEIERWHTWGDPAGEAA